MKQNSNQWLKFILISACALSSIMANNSVAMNKLLDDYLTVLPKGTDTSILIQSVNETPKTLLDYQSDQFKQPASIQKIITALAAQLELGADFRFITRMQTDGKIQKKQLNGNLIITMSGDPTFTRNQLKEMINVLKLKGIDKIKGNIIIDTSIFGSHDKAPGWSWNNLTACYNTKPSATIIDGNCFYAGLTSAKKIGGEATVSISPIYPISITSDVRTISSMSDELNDKYCELDMVYQDNRYQLIGCLKHSSNKQYFHFAVLNEIDYFSSILKSQLAQQKITFTGSIIESKKPITKPLVPLAVNQSEPLPELLAIMLKKSNNLIADTVFRTIGAHYYSQKTDATVAGTWRNSGDAVKAILQENADIDLDNAVIADGSGLSRLNLIDANKMMQILQYIAAHNETLQLIDKLPVAGVDGTLQYRRSFTKNQLKSVVYAKTGYLEGNYNLAGYIKRGENDYVAFIQFISGYNYLNGDSEPKNAPIMTFEEALYTGLIK